MEEWGERKTDACGSDVRRRRRTNRRTSVFTSTPTSAPLEDRCTKTVTSAHIGAQNARVHLPARFSRSPPKKMAGRTSHSGRA